MTNGNDRTNDEAIRELLDSWTSALRTKDLAGLMSHYDKDIVSFDLLPPLEYRGVDEYRKNWEEWFASFAGPIGYEIRGLSITAGDDVTFSHSFNHITGTRTNGEQSNAWVRATIGYRKIADTWMIVHEHFSVPFDMKTLKASLDLQP